jgi:GAF domain-containing protein
VALYLIADGVFGLAAGVAAAGLPAELSENEPLFVRMRASRHAELARDSGSDIDAEIAFPMFVRATLVGALVLGAKRTGETYDPEEVALLAELAQRVGMALDALQTVVMRRELEALMGATGGASAAL